MKKYTAKDVDQNKIAFGELTKDQFNKLFTHFKNYYKNCNFEMKYSPNAISWRFYSIFGHDWCCGMSHDRYERLTDGIFKAKSVISFDQFDFENFVLPPNWYVVVTEENKDVLSDWRFGKNRNDCLLPGYIVGIPTGYVLENSREHNKTNNSYDIKHDGEYDFGEEISFELFQEYVLKEIPQYVSKEDETICLAGIDYKVVIYNNKNETFYYLTLLQADTQNDLIFHQLKIDKLELCKELFDYTPNYLNEKYYFPEVKSIKDLNKIIHEIKKVENMKKEIVGYKLAKPEYKSAAIAICESHKDNTDYSYKYWDQNFENFGYLFTYICDQSKWLKEAGVLDLWFEPVYVNEFNVNDWVVITKSGYGTNSSDIGLVCKIVSIDKNKKNNYDVEIDRDKIGNFDRFLGSNALRKATEEEIEKANQKVFKVGNFGIIVRNKQAYHKNDNITQFVNELIDKFSLKSNAGGYTFIVKDIIFSKTGCENTESKLSEWVKVYNEII